MKQKIMKNVKTLLMSLWNAFGRILFNSLILALILYRPKLNFVILMDEERQYSMEIDYTEILRPIPTAVIFSLLLVVPTSEGGIILPTSVFSLFCMPWMYSCCTMFVKNLSQYMQCLLLSLDLDINAYRICYITIFHVTIFIMAVELMSHWITLHRCRRSMKTRIIGDPYPFMLCIRCTASRQPKKVTLHV